MSAPRHRPALIALVVLAAAACLALGWWQWGRFEANGGNGQNLGYALQWPLFAGFFGYAYRRFIRLEAEREAGDEAPAAKQSRTRVTEIPAGLLPERPAPAQAPDDPELADYNRYLAELNRAELTASESRRNSA
ncbi:MAG: hypothetical protein HOQ24_19105 [Mycobacteriaceae bacterium]|nr:hypothetical protein [Mycobacteriaceae bacterium]